MKQAARPWIVGGVLAGALLLSTAPRADVVRDEPPPHERHKSPRTEPGYVTFVGFHKQDGAPRVFVRLTSEVTPTQQVSGDELVVTLPGFKLDMQNNGRPLDTRYFGTRVVRVRAQQIADKGVDVHVTFAREAGEAQVSTVKSPPEDPGGLYLYLDFPG